MVLIGTNETCLLSGIFSNVKCPNCNFHSEINYSISTRYTSLTFIPIFPVGNTIQIECNHCSKEISFEDLDENLKVKLIIENKKVNQKRPLWLFSGVIILICWGVFYLFNLYQTKDETKILIQNPISGDVYNLKIQNRYFSSMRIDNVTKDSVFATENDYKVYLQSEIEEINKVENYTKRKVSYSKKELLSLLDKNEIFSIIRK